MDLLQKDRGSRQVLVTGGGGFLGSAIVGRLVERGDRVRSFSRGFYPKLQHLGVEQVRGDIAEAEAVESACRGVELVFHVAAKPGVWGRYEDFFKVNVVGTRNVIAACKRHRIGRLIHTSSPSVVFNGKDMEGVDESAPYPERYLSHYPKTKAMAEREVITACAEGIHAIILRPHLIWGPEDNHLVPRILQRAKHLKKVGSADNLVDTVYIDNAADAHLLAADRLNENPALSGRVFFISQDDPIPLWHMVDAILEAADLSPVKGRISARTAWYIGAVLEGLYRMFRLKGEPRMTRFVAEELATAHWFDISAARKDLGYSPKVSTAEGLEKLGQWLKNKRR